MNDRITTGLERFWSRQSPSVVGLAAIAGLLIVGALDWATGTEVRIFSLYFPPLMLSAWFMGRRAAVSLSLLAGVIWVVANRLSGLEYSAASIWAINFATQCSTFVVVSILVSALRDALSRERALARTDWLTGLANSRAFHEQAKTLLALCRRNCRPVTLAFVDLDNFKSANDRLGHQHGDLLLRRAASGLSRSLRASDLTGRLGGDEFAVLMPETDASQARAALEKVRGSLQGDAELQAAAVTATIGAVCYGTAPEILATAISAADQVMYAMKTAGKNRVQVDEMPPAAKPPRPGSP